MLAKAALLLAACAPVCLLAQTNNAIVHKVDEHYNHLNSLRAHYSERYSGMGMDRTEEGTLLLKKPGRMRWSYAAPVGKVFVLDGKFGWFYTPGDAQATRVPAKQLDDLRSPLRFLLGHTQLDKELDGLAVAPEGAAFRISGVPKGMAQRVKLLSLWVIGGGSHRADAVGRGGRRGDGVRFFGNRGEHSGEGFGLWVCAAGWRDRGAGSGTNVNGLPVASS